MTEQHLIGRQAIVSKAEEIVAYELLFRSTAAPDHAEILDDVSATSTTIVSTISCFGTQAAMGRHRGFINVDADLLMSDTLEILPPERFGIELLETVAITPGVIGRCRELKAKGYLLALDDHMYDPRCRELYDGVVDVIKIDITGVDSAGIALQVERFKPYPVKLLAEKVDSRERYLECDRLGFDLFQGNMFSRPAVMRKRRWDESSAVILKLMQQLTGDAELEDVEQTIKESPPLVYKLLVLVNSISLGLRTKVVSIRHAVMMIGLRQLKRWVQLAIFATDAESCLNDPVIDLAAVRAVFMEELVKLTPLVRRNRYAADEGYMVGILSILTVVFDVPMVEIVANLQLSDEVMDALLNREGDYGVLLSLVEMVENLEFERAAERLEALGIPLMAVLNCQKTAYSWRFGL